MKINFIGTGAAFDFAKGTSSALITIGGMRILLDCGYSTLPRLAEKGMVETIDYILLTHLHADHVGSLPTLLPYIEVMLEKKVPPIIVPDQAFADEINTFLAVTYEQKRAQHIPISEFPQIGYVDTTDKHWEGMASYAYYFVEEDHLIYYSGDIGTVLPARDFLKTRNESLIQVFHETTFATNVPSHTPYTDVQKELAGYDTYIYHIDKDFMPDDCTLTPVEDRPEFLL